MPGSVTGKSSALPRGVVNQSATSLGASGAAHRDLHVNGAIASLQKFRMNGLTKSSAVPLAHRTAIAPGERSVNWFRGLASDTRAPVPASASSAPIGMQTNNFSQRSNGHVVSAPCDARSARGSAGWGQLSEHQCTGWALASRDDSSPMPRRAEMAPPSAEMYSPDDLLEMLQPAVGSLYNVMSSVREALGACSCWFAASAVPLGVTRRGMLETHSDGILNKNFWARCGLFFRETLR